MVIDFLSWRSAILLSLTIYINELDLLNKKSDVIHNIQTATYYEVNKQTERTSESKRPKGDEAHNTASLHGKTRAAETELVSLEFSPSFLFSVP